MRAVFEAQDGGFADLIDGGFAFFFGYAEADAVERGSLQRFVNQAVDCVKVFAFDFEHGFFFPACLDAFAVVVFIARAGAAVEDFGLEFVVLYGFVEVVEFFLKRFVHRSAVFAFGSNAEVGGHGVAGYFEIGGLGKFDHVVMKGVGFGCGGQGGCEHEGGKNRA